MSWADGSNALQSLRSDSPARIAKADMVTDGCGPWALHAAGALAEQLKGNCGLYTQWDTTWQ